MRDTLDKVVRVIEADPHAGSSLTFYALVSTLKMENSGCLYALTRLRELSSEHRQLAYELMELMAREGNRGDAWEAALATMEEAIRAG